MEDLTRLIPAFWQRTTIPACTNAAESCWLWSGSRTNNGYGVLSWRDPGRKGRSMAAHRFAYRLLVGEIPQGLELDHLCRVRDCVNPAHLEPVTRDENMRRAGARPWWSKISRCKRGHEMTPENTYVRPDNGHRQCVACIRLRSRTDNPRSAA